MKEAADRVELTRKQRGDGYALFQDRESVMNALTLPRFLRGLFFARTVCAASLFCAAVPGLARAGNPPPLAVKLRSHIPQPPPAAAPVAPAPRYLLLQGVPGGVGQTVRGTPYAYGWFGAGPRGHSEYFRGYYGETRIIKIR